MTLTLDSPSTSDPPTASRAGEADPAVRAAGELRHAFAAARVSFTWLGVRKSLSPEQKAQAAEPFGAHGQFLSAAKKLLGTRDDAFRQVTAVRSRIVSYWKGMSLPYPEPGVRLIRHEDVQSFGERLGQFRRDLQQAVEHLDDRYGQMKEAARRRLGSLYREEDYPAGLRGLFDVEHEFPSVEPPSYLQRLSPRLYELERQRVAARFDEAVRLAEQAFAGELAELVDHLAERLAPGPEGERKTFRDSAVVNFGEFFRRFGALNIGSNPQLEELVGRAQSLLRGRDAPVLRDAAGLREQVARGLSVVRAGLDELLVDVPRRRVLRGSAAGGGNREKGRS